MIFDSIVKEATKCFSSQLFIYNTLEVMDDKLLLDRISNAVFVLKLENFETSSAFIEL